MQISVVVANIRTRPSKTEVEKGSVPTAVEHGSVGPKTQAKVFPKGAGSVSLSVTVFCLSSNNNNKTTTTSTTTTTLTRTSGRPSVERESG